MIGAQKQRRFCGLLALAGAAVLLPVGLVLAGGNPNEREVKPQVNVQDKGDVWVLHFKFKDTPVIATEAAYLFDPASSAGRKNYPGIYKSYPGIYKFGAVINPGPFPNIVNGVTASGNYLLYFMANQAIYRPSVRSDLH